MSEGQTWSSEDARVFSYKVFFGSARRCHFVSVVSSSTDRLPSSEAERIVFAAEGLLLAHRFPFNCGIRVERHADVIIASDDCRIKSSRQPASSLTALGFVPQRSLVYCFAQIDDRLAPSRNSFDQRKKID
jgi:hypothetical protein